MRSYHLLTLAVIAAVFYWIGAAYPALARRVGVA